MQQLLEEKTSSVRAAEHGPPALVRMATEINT